MPFVPDHLLGPAAGLATSFAWTVTSLLFAAAGRRLGSTVLNAIRIVLAVILLGATFKFFTSETGAWFPSATSKQLIFLALSGIIGLSIGDQALFTAFVDVGPRTATLIMTTAPIFAAAFGFAFLGETLGGATAWVGMAMTIVGVAIVVLERPTDEERHEHRARGIILALVGAACQAGGLLLSKIGIGHGWLDDAEHMNPQAATYVRMSFAALGMIPILMFRKLGKASRRGGSPRVGLILAFCGACVGPYLGVWLSLVAADNTDVGIAQTLMSLTPVLILPWVIFVDRERVGWRGIVGALVAVAGVAVLFVAA